MTFKRTKAPPNAIESINRAISKALKKLKSLQADDLATKVIYLALVIRLYGRNV